MSNPILLGQHPGQNGENDVRNGDREAENTSNCGKSVRCGAGSTSWLSPFPADLRQGAEPQSLGLHISAPRMNTQRTFPERV